MSKVRLGLLVNPVAGIGGRVALKGSDGPAVQQEALRRGARPIAHERAALALEALRPAEPEFELVTYPGAMGKHVAESSHLTPTVVGSIAGITTADDTRRAASELKRVGVDLILFVGGDGTAVDVLGTLGRDVPVIGVPAGVKMHSAVFSVNPRCAGELAVQYVRNPSLRLRHAEVMDVDEEALRAGIVAPRLHGYLRVPVQPRMMQGAKARAPLHESDAVAAIAAEVAHRMESSQTYLFGPGTTTNAILQELGLGATLLGVDAVRDGQLVARDATEADLLALIGDEASIVISPIGGQGFLFGRGNQQLSAAVIRLVGRERILVVAAEEKVAALRGLPFSVDTGDPALDEELRGYVRVITGYRQEIVYPIFA
jgi:predicted polyphosphate/ATP-dependent NAD kinase